MTFKRTAETFDLTDIGAQVIDQISSDIYSGPGSIVREIVKNAYDAYLALEATGDDDDGARREILITRRRLDSGIGILTIADRGIGQSLKKLRENVQISISHKQSDLDDAMGFRGLGSWAVLGAGSKVTITSKLKGMKQNARLHFNVRRIYETITPESTLDDILNDPECIEFSTEDLSGAFDEHGTTVEIECDGDLEKVNNLELNRLYPYTVTNETELRQILSQYCPIPYAAAYTQVHEVYARSRYVPTGIVLDGESLERSLPSNLSAYITHDIMVGTTTAGVAWYVEDPDNTGAVSTPPKHLVGGAGIQLSKLNVPIGAKNAFLDDEGRDQNLKWYVGEVQVILSDVLPNASGDDLRAGSSRDIFIAELNKFYKGLDKRARQKSLRLNYTRHLKRAKDAVAVLKGKPSAEDRVKNEGYVLKGVQTIDDIQKKSRGGSEDAQSTRDVLADTELRALFLATKRLLKKEGHLDVLGKNKGTKKSKKKKSGRPTAGGSADAPDDTANGADTFSAIVARHLPALEKLGLTQAQMQGVLALISALFVDYEST